MCLYICLVFKDQFACITMLLHSNIFRSPQFTLCYNNSAIKLSQPLCSLFFKNNFIAEKRLARTRVTRATIKIIVNTRAHTRDFKRPVAWPLPNINNFSIFVLIQIFLQEWRSISLECTWNQHIKRKHSIKQDCCFHHPD